MSLLKKLNIKPLKNIIGLQWLFLWGKEWLLPKIGVAFGVYSISKILFSLNSSLWTEGQTGEVLSNFLETGSEIRTLVIALSLGLLFLVAVVTSAANIINKFFFHLNLKISLIVDGLIFIANIAFVPLIFSVYIAIHLCFDSLLNESLYSLAALICVSSALHFFKNYETNPENFIFYTIKNVKDTNTYYGHAIKKTEKKLTKYVSRFNCVNNPVIVAHSKDGGIILAIPILLKFEYWHKVGKLNKNDFFKTLDKIEQEWLNDGWSIIRFDSFDGAFFKPALHRKNVIICLFASVAWLLVFSFL